jgi:hypothetical protein
LPNTKMNSSKNSSLSCRDSAKMDLAIAVAVDVGSRVDLKSNKEVISLKLSHQQKKK